LTRIGRDSKQRKMKRRVAEGRLNGPDVYLVVQTPFETVETQEL
jgi:hypothetical protein